MFTRYNGRKLSFTAMTVFLVMLFPYVYADAHKAEVAHSKHKQFTQCAAIRMKEIKLEHLKNPEKYTTPVPDGWTVVSGSGGEGHPKLLICR